MKQLTAVIAIVLFAAACSSSDDTATEPTTTTTTEPALTTAPSTTTTEASTTTTTTVPPCGSGGDLALGQQSRTVTTTDGLDREFLLFLPASYEEGTPADVVFNFHGRGSNAIEQHLYGFFVPFAEEDNVILVNPEALPAAEGEPVRWIGRFGSDVDGPYVPADDVDFVLDLVDLIRSEYCTGDLFAAGMSSGGSMSSRLGCLENSPFRGIAPVTLSHHTPGCDAAPSTTFVYFHGTDDGTVPFEGGGTLDSAPDTAQEWADHNGCDSEPAEERVSDEVVRFSWSACDASTDFYVVEGGGHTWPGGVDVPGLGYNTRDISATEIIWEAFFG